MRPNTITDMLGIRYPVFQGPMGAGLSTPALVAAVTNAGGLGGYGAYTLQPAEIRELGAQVGQLTAGPWNLNLWVSDIDPALGNYTEAEFDMVKSLFRPVFDELGIPVPSPVISVESKFARQAEAMLAVKPAVFSFVFGIPDEAILQECRRQGIVTAGAATTLDEALALEAAGVDVIVAAGFEAGGHRPSFLEPAEDSLHGTFALVQKLRWKVRKPIVAAGGIADAAGVEAALRLGAAAVQVGTAFLACEESGASATYRDRLFSPAAQHTELTRVYTGRLARAVRTQLPARFAGMELELAPFPLQSQLMAPVRKAALDSGQLEYSAVWAGQNAGNLHHRKATDLMEELTSLWR
ncbi:NAD(P)H-dependent flavin oxidoreductase [Chitinophaga caseinilytica]|uniref:Propionate 3-nitronate monooxygenase n=1 Tax=Chitinophaga caseinilytica TaxID=2267521 RepID=A0ABZ2Z1N5_9BACT